MGEGCCFACCCPGALTGLRIKLRTEQNIQVYLIFHLSPSYFPVLPLFVPHFSPAFLYLMYLLCLLFLALSCSTSTPLPYPSSFSSSFPLLSPLTLLLQSPLLPLFPLRIAPLYSFFSYSYLLISVLLRSPTLPPLPSSCLSPFLLLLPCHLFLLSSPDFLLFPSRFVSCSPFLPHLIFLLPPSCHPSCYFQLLLSIFPYFLNCPPPLLLLFWLPFPLLPSDPSFCSLRTPHTPVIFPIFSPFFLIFSPPPQYPLVSFLPTFLILSLHWPSLAFIGLHCLLLPPTLPVFLFSSFSSPPLPSLLSLLPSHSPPSFLVPSTPFPSPLPDKQKKKR